MKVHFKFPRAIDGSDFAKGVHHIPDAKSDHWFLQALIKSGDVTIVEEAKPAEEVKASESKPEKAEDEEDSDSDSKAAKKQPSQPQRKGK